MVEGCGDVRSVNASVWTFTPVQINFEVLWPVAKNEHFLYCIYVPSLDGEVNAVASADFST